MHKKQFGSRAPPGPPGELKRSPRLPSRNVGPISSKRRGREEEKRRGENERKEGRDWRRERSPQQDLY